MDHVAALLTRHFPGSDRELRVGGVSIRQIAGEFGTPLFVYDASVLDRKWTELRETLPPEFSICYSVKANPNRAILRRFLDKGAGLEVASAGELKQALAAGCPAERVLFAGSGPVAFTNGAPTSALTYTFSGLGNAGDDVEFSNNGGTLWTYTPVANASGCDPAVTHIRVRPKGTMAAASGAGNPYFEVRFRVRLN